MHFESYQIKRYLLKKIFGFFFRLGLATAPVLFAADEREELDSLINRRFSHEGKGTMKLG